MKLSRQVRKRSKQANKKTRNTRMKARIIARRS